MAKRHQKADIDLLVELKPPENRPRLGLEWFGLEEELSCVLGREVELIAEGSKLVFAPLRRKRSRSAL